MNLFHRRHLALFCALFAVAALGGCFLKSSHKWVWGLSILGVAVLIALFLPFFKKHRAALLKCVLCLIFAAAALIESYLVIDRERDKLAPLLGQTTEAEITIIGKNTTSEYFSSYEAMVIFGHDNFDAVLECEYKGDFSVGDILWGQVLVTGIEDQQENVSYYLARGVYISLLSSEDTLSVMDSGYSNFKIKMRSLNAYLSNILEKEVGGKQADLVSAISLGNKKLLDNEILRDFRRAGLSHVLAISGMHLSVIMLVLENLLRRFGVRKELRCVLIFFIAFFYLALTGFSLSTVRAFIMVSFVYLAFLSRNDNDTITSLFFSLFLIFVIWPNSVWDVGIWLSFLAVLGILTVEYFTKKITARLYESQLKKHLIKITVYILSSLLVTIAANIFVCFPMWLYFKELSLISVLSNLIISPLISLVLFAAPLMLLISFIPLLSYITPAIAFVLRALCSVIINIVSWLSRLEDITVSLNYNFAGYIIIPATALLFLLLILPLRRKFWIPLIPTIAVVLFTGCLIVHNNMNAETLTADYLSYGESEMLLLTTTEDTVICDFSTGATTYLYQSITFSKERFSTEISAVVLTHYHTYHISTFSRSAARTVIREIYLPFPQNSDEYHLMRSLIDVAGKAGTKVILYDRDEDFSPAENITLNLSNIAYLKRSTHPTFALTVSAFDKRLTYVAESAHEAEELYTVIEARLQASDFVIFGTHGPLTKTDFSYDGLSASQYIIISNPTVLSHFKPQSGSKVITDSSLVTFRMEQ